MTKEDEWWWKEMWRREEERLKKMSEEELEVLQKELEEEIELLEAEQVAAMDSVWYYYNLECEEAKSEVDREYCMEEKRKWYYFARGCGYDREDRIPELELIKKIRKEKRGRK
jgi:hypothetical protein